MQRNRHLNILLADDNPISAKIFQNYWQRLGLGHNVFVVSDGQQAIDRITRDNLSIDIIFTDIEMPIKDGFTIVREIRTYETENHLSPIPIIGVSGYQTKHYQEKAIQSGMNYFMSKGQSYKMVEVQKIIEVFCGDPVP